MSHGIGGYRSGCKCVICRAANALRVARNRARRAADPDRLSHGTRSAYDAGCRCEPCTDERRIAYLREGGYRPHRWREYVTAAYHEARDALAAIRESRRPAWRAAGGANSGAGCDQLSDAEFAAAYGRVTFRDILHGARGWATSAYV